VLYCLVSSQPYAAASSLNVSEIRHTEGTQTRRTHLVYALSNVACRASCLGAERNADFLHIRHGDRNGGGG
jgi:hypothetical protein